MNGYDSQSTITLGAYFDVDVVVQMTGTTTLSAYQFSVNFDSSVLQFKQAASEKFTPGFALYTNGFTTGTSNESVTTISGFDAGTFGSGLVGRIQFIAARLNFAALTTFDDGLDENEILTGLFTLGDAVLDNTSPLTQPITPIFKVADLIVTAVPEPSSLAMVGLAGLVAAVRTVCRTNPRRRTNKGSDGDNRF